MSKTTNNNTESEVTVEAVAKADELFNIKSAEGEFIDIVDNFDTAKDIADKNIGASVYKDGEDVALYTSMPVEPVVTEPVVEQPKPVIKPNKKQKQTEACVKVVAVDDVVSVAEEVVVTAPNKLIMPGMMVRLNRQPIYKTAYIPQPFKLYEGNVFIYDGNLINGRYRITSAANLCGTEVKNVIGYIPASYIK